MASLRRYWMLEGRLRFPRLANERLLLDLHVQRYEFPEEEFFGIGADSLRGNDVSYSLRNTLFGATAAVSPVRWFTVGGTVDRLNPGIGAGSEPGSIRSRFSSS